MFRLQIKRQNLKEWTDVYWNKYDTPRKPSIKRRSGSLAMLKIPLESKLVYFYEKLLNLEWKQEKSKKSELIQGNSMVQYKLLFTSSLRIQWQ